MSMFLILPDQVDPGIRDLEHNITTSLVKELMATLQVKEEAFFRRNFQLELRSKNI
jgi:hypothetical protein